MPNINDSSSLESWLEYINSCHPKEMDLGLDNIFEILSKHPINKFSAKVITVAGTNGKGSCVYTLTRLLMAAGCKVGSYYSPHILTFNERVRINSKPVSDQILINAFEHIESIREDVELTFFEFTTLAALWIFQEQQNLDFIVLEVGLGGRLDAVNCVEPDLAIITSIALDHQEYLGNSIESISKEKAGILRAKIPVVLGRSADCHNVLARTHELQNPIYIAEQHFKLLDKATKWCFDGKTIALPEYSLNKNSVSVAFAAYTILAREWHLPVVSQLTNKITNLQLEGRLQEITGKIPILLDVAHNPAAACSLAESLAARPLTGKRFAIWSSLDDKDLPNIVKPLKQCIDDWNIGELDKSVARAASLRDLSYALTINDITHNKFKNIAVAINNVLASANHDDELIIFGSFYTVCEALKCIRSLEVKDNYIVANQLSEA